MYSIAPRLAGNYSTNEGLNNLLDAIDAKIIAMAECEYNDIRFGLDNCDVSLDDYDDLCTYRAMLLDRILGCECLNQTMLIPIVSRIKKLIK